MCGIVGSLNFLDTAPAADLSAALACLHQRGPDHQATYTHGPVALGHARLSILDTSSAAHQPMISDDGRYTIVFNGEIYNFKQLRQQLERDGHTFTSDGDTEVLLKLYLHEGPAALQKLNGFFAFAVYDTEAQSLFIARDRMGIKPLLFWYDSARFAFASELKSMLALGIPRKLDHSVLGLFLQLNYVPPNASMLQGVQKLQPGHYLTVEANGSVEQHRYWQLPQRGEQRHPTPTSYDQAVDDLRDRLSESVQRRMIADVPLGVFLSGGLDSSIVAALATRNSDKVRTFSLGFENKLFDESDYALAVARHIGTEHTRFEVNAERLQEVVEDVLTYIDEPFADASASNMFILSRLTRQHVTVALSGDGADELFGGYSKHYGEFRARHDNLLNAAIDSSAPLLNLLPGTRNSKLGRKIWQVQKYARDRKLSKAERYWAWCCVQLPGEASRLLKQQPTLDAISAIRSTYLEEIASDGDMNDVFRADLRLVLDGDMLRKVDLMSMANSLEIRVPFLDHTVVEWAANLPAEWKVTAKQRKRILQDVGRPLLPDLIYNRPKQGFEVPLRDWMIGPLRPELDRLLFDRDFIAHQGLFNHTRILELRDAVESGKYAKEDMSLWALLTFQRFWERWF